MFPPVLLSCSLPFAHEVRSQWPFGFSGPSAKLTCSTLEQCPSNMLKTLLVTKMTGKVMQPAQVFITGQGQIVQESGSEKQWQEKLSSHFPLATFQVHLIESANNCICC